MWENFVKTTIEATVAIGADAISINAASAPFNTPIDPEGSTAYLVLLDDINNPTKFEIISYTGRTGTGPYTLSGVTKGVNGTEDQEWGAGDLVVQDHIALELNAVIYANRTKELTAGYTTASYDAGTITTGTFTPDPTKRNIQHIINGGDNYIAPPASPCYVIVEYVNNASAGVITATGFDDVDGDALTTTDGDVFQFAILVTNTKSTLTIKAAQ